ncbi:3'-5' exonuclease [Jiangella gansuensis]|uniref:3'-5' exonuclease n=1 Tax=Jiangella gansuensis TaxID=281473 RepID=UPI00047ACE5F|nr:3'-5' exonuclease [Jiangella gansuensis]
MASVTMSKQFTKDIDVDGSLKNRAWDFVRKVMNDPTAPGLHIEPIAGSRDPRVRTGRVNDGYRAVMFLVRDDPEQAYVLAAIKQHDDANRYAERAVLRTNPVNGVLEVLEDIDEQVTGTVSASTPIARQATEPVGPLASFQAMEFEEIGITPRFAAAAIAAADEDALLDALHGAPSWQADVLLSVATGIAIEDALENVGVQRLDKVPRSTDIDTALAQPGSQMDFVTVHSDDALREVLEGPFEAWRTFLHPEQRQYAERRTYNGAFRLRGGAGTGKTVVAIHRARALARRSGSRIVLTTYTTTLAKNLARDLDALDPSVQTGGPVGSDGVVVRGVDKLAREVLYAVDSRVFEKIDSPLLNAGPRGLSPLGDVDDRNLWQDVIDQAGVDLPPELARPDFLRSEYRMVILGQQIDSSATYARAPRPGRGTRLGRAQRLAVWSLVETYRRRLAMKRQASFPELAALAAMALDTHFELTGERLADHVVIDEAQDLHAGHWRLLRALVAEESNDLFICEDSHQRIYGEKVVLSRFGIAVRGRSRRLTLNYRTTAQNLSFAIGLLEGHDVTDLEGEPETMVGYRSLMNGPAPNVVACSSMSDELDEVAARVKAWQTDDALEPHTIGVLARSARTRDLIQRGLTDRGVPVHAVVGDESWTGKAPSLLTMHRAKGLEFRKVILVGIDENQIPSIRALNGMPPDERDDVANRERFLLYVAMTRAREELVLTWHGKPSGFLDPLPTDRGESR